MSVKKLGKKIEGNEVVFTLGEADGEELRFDATTLPEEIKARLIPFAVGHKLGDAAASSKTVDEIKAAINRVWDALMANTWTSRAPTVEGEAKEKTPKISKKTILANLEKLPPEQQESAKILLAAMGITV